MAKKKDQASAKRKTDNIQDAYDEAVRQGKGDQFIKSHPQFAEKNGLSVADPETTTQEKIKANVDDIAKSSSDYGAAFADKYLPSGTFGTIDATTSPAMQDYLNRLNQFSQTAYDMTPEEQKALGALEAGLGGYTSTEMQAQREAADREAKRQYQTILEQNRVAQIQSGVRGAAALAQNQDLNQQRIQSTAQLQQDLLVKNADEIQNRKEAFNDSVRKTEDARFGRKTTSEGMYGAALSGEEAARTGREMYNVGQAQNEGLARSGLALSGAGLYSGLYGSEAGLQASTDQFNQLLAQQNEWQKFSMAQTEAANKRAEEESNRYWNWMNSQ